eukprot:CAMPEP_0202692966 /NCGR_PEP_ID=MMETSP1385-20130828/7207_1 /ASSEMBLY_ACC=CAM_ASM_000861 /TAXON_ID=933848 /ORGANISM="Elphidium margaritaceum" /LENGTH=285 /DNA_ID=CAMNT_0049348579 /DNA_START=21 /DNA_END=878 /DNA_ORIENTATION=+
MSSKPANKRRLDDDTQGLLPPQKKAKLEKVEKVDKNDEKSEKVSESNIENKSAFTQEMLQKKKVPELKELCRKRGLKVGGNKATLITRLLDPELTATKNGTSSSKKTSKRRSVKMVHDMLRDAGVEDPESVNPCLKKGIQKGFFTIDADGGLDQIIFRGGCLCCSKKYDVSIRDVLYQSVYGGNDYEDGGEGGAIQCEDCCGLYVTRLCEGRPGFDCGKFHNHCTECPGFGQCIGDYREAHCERCNKHYFQGLSGFACENCKRKGLISGDYDDDDDDEADDCCIQ